MFLTQDAGAEQQKKEARAARRVPRAPSPAVESANAARRFGSAPSSAGSDKRTAAVALGSGDPDFEAKLAKRAERFKQ